MNANSKHIFTKQPRCALISYKHPKFFIDWVVIDLATRSNVPEGTGREKSNNEQNIAILVNHTNTLSHEHTHKPCMIHTHPEQP